MVYPNGKKKLLVETKVSVQRIVMVYLHLYLYMLGICQRFRTTNCYGLSFELLLQLGLSFKFPYNELLWFIPRKIKVCIFSIA